MLKAKDEYLNPSQNYRRKDKFDYLYTNRQTKSKFLPQKMSFILIEQKITPPRIYAKSISAYYKLIREISLPNFSKFSISKLLYGNKVLYYFKIFYKKKLTQLLLINKHITILRSNKKNMKVEDPNKIFIDAICGEEISENIASAIILEIEKSIFNLKKTKLQ